MSKKSIKTLLLIEDNPGDARLFRETFKEQGSHDTELTYAKSMSEAEKHLAAHSVDIIILDLGLPDTEGLEAVRRAHVSTLKVSCDHVAAESRPRVKSRPKKVVPEGSNLSEDRL